MSTNTRRGWRRNPQICVPPRSLSVLREKKCLLSMALSRRRTPNKNNTTTAAAAAAADERLSCFIGKVVAKVFALFYPPMDYESANANANGGRTDGRICSGSGVGRFLLFVYCFSRSSWNIVNNMEDVGFCGKGAVTTGFPAIESDKLFPRRRRWRRQLLRIWECGGWWWSSVCGLVS